MSDKAGHADVESNEGGVAVQTKPAPVKRPPQLLPPYKVLLHNDDVNDIGHVIESIIMIAALNFEDAVLRTKEAHETGVALILTTHRERAELIQQQFASRGLTATIEPA
jgi:ATP-dependent Clp protease adaptor protein ClpS